MNGGKVGDRGEESLEEHVRVYTLRQAVVHCLDDKLES